MLGLPLALWLVWHLIQDMHQALICPDIVFSETLTEEQALNVPDQHSSSDEVELDDRY